MLNQLVVHINWFNGFHRIYIQPNFLKWVLHMYVSFNVRSVTRMNLGYILNTVLRHPSCTCPAALLLELTDQQYLPLFVNFSPGATSPPAGLGQPTTAACFPWFTWHLPLLSEHDPRPLSVPACPADPSWPLVCFRASFPTWSHCTHPMIPSQNVEVKNADSKNINRKTSSGTKRQKDITSNGN
jgi:hypothetical protein